MWRPPHNYMMFKFKFSLIIKTIEWYKIAIGGIFNIYKYIIKWRPQHPYKFIFTLNVESFLSDTVADSLGEGTCVDHSNVAWKFSMNF